MGKRSDFRHHKNDFYPTPAPAVVPLIPHLQATTYVEPCAGAGDLIHHLAQYGLECVEAFDIDPQHPSINQASALDYRSTDDRIIITNPPWTRQLLHPMIEHLAEQHPTWLLLDADWMHTKQARPYLKLCRKIVSVGRLKWIPGSKHTGKDNCCWYLFDAGTEGEPVFVSRC